MKDSLLHKFHPEVMDAIIEVFTYAQSNEKNPSDFLLFLNNGHRSKIKMDSGSDIMIGFGLRGIADNNRHEFFHFYHKYMRFEDLYNEIEDQDKRKEVEMKICLS